MPTRVLLATGLLLLAFSLRALPTERDKNIARDPSLLQRFEQGKKWAVVVGVNKYLDPAIPSLEFCVADARRLARALTQRCGYAEERILVIADDQPADHLRPLRINLLMQIPAWLRHAGEGDTVVVFFSGHGFLDERGQGFLAPKDCLQENLGLSGFRTDDLGNMLAQCKATQKLLILDCCHAGAGKGDQKAGASSAELGAAFEQARGLITLASCRQEERSQEWRENRQGLFTYFLAKGLEGEADYDGNAIVDSDELYRYTVDKVPLTAQRVLNARQTPVRFIPRDAVGVFPLARVAGLPIAEARPHVVAAFQQPIRNSVGMTLTWIPAGEFLMGSPDSESDAGNETKPQHRVRITSPFYLGVTEVTQEQYQRVMGENPSEFQGDPQRPVEMVSWENANEFCRRLGRVEGKTYRLPTEAEWEYACRAQNATVWCFGDDESQLGEHAWFGANSDSTTHPVGRKKPNDWGLYDMHGNVWEWCADWYGEGYHATSAAVDPRGPSTGEDRVLRGGSWGGSAKYARSACRGRVAPDTRDFILGFRVARTP